MDWSVLRSRLNCFFEKYKYVLLVLMVGIFLMVLPSREEDEPAEQVQPETGNTPTIQEQLEQILAQIDGVGKVQVMLSLAAGSETIYQSDTDTASDGSVRCETVIVSDSNRDQAGLVRTVTLPTYLGAIVVCQGAERPAVQLAVVQAVSNITGISADRITVLKMK